MSNRRLYVFGREVRGEITFALGHSWIRNSLEECCLAFEQNRNRGNRLLEKQSQIAVNFVSSDSYLLTES